jgi:hypothetical protein
MTMTSAHAATSTVDCAWKGCDKIATKNIGSKGPYSDLCDVHYEEQRQRFSRLLRAPAERREQLQDEAASQNGPPQPRERLPEPASGSLKEAAQALVGPAAAVDQAKRRKSAADGEYERVRVELAAAVENFKLALQTFG